MSVKSQFGSVGYNGNNFLLDSFSVIGADTRNGFDLETATRIAAMHNYVGAHPDKVDAAKFGAYVQKLDMGGSTGAQPIVTVARSKPGNGM
jgi:hypothetical protein